MADAVGVESTRICALLEEELRSARPISCAVDAIRLLVAWWRGDGGGYGEARMN